MDKDVIFSVTLSERQAIALAELCKRIGWSDCRNNAVSDDEAERMLTAMDKVRGGLSDVGINVR
jgi:hypothetical protein